MKTLQPLVLRTTVATSRKTELRFEDPRREYPNVAGLKSFH